METKKTKLGETKFGNKDVSKKMPKGKAEFVDYDKVGKTKITPPKTALDKKIEPYKKK